jgi:hypothetical protein
MIKMKMFSLEQLSFPREMKCTKQFVRVEKRAVLVDQVKRRVKSLNLSAVKLISFNNGNLQLSFCHGELYALQHSVKLLCFLNKFNRDLQNNVFNKYQLNSCCKASRSPW